MKGQTPSLDMDFIRIFFPRPQEEEIAARLAHCLASSVGEQALQLRPNTTFSEIFAWVGDGDAAEFILGVEEELGLELDEVAEDIEEMTFREFVKYWAER